MIDISIMKSQTSKYAGLLKSHISHWWKTHHELHAQVLDLQQRVFLIENALQITKRHREFSKPLARAMYQHPERVHKALNNRSTSLILHSLVDNPQALGNYLTQVMREEFKEEVADECRRHLRAALSRKTGEG